MKKARIISSLNSIILSLALITNIVGCASSPTVSLDAISEAIISKAVTEDVDTIYNMLIDENIIESEKKQFIEEFVAKYHTSGDFDEFLTDLFDQMNDEQFFYIFPLFISILGENNFFYYVQERLNCSDKPLEEKLELVLICNTDKVLDAIELTLSKKEFEEYASRETLCTQKNQGYYSDKVDKWVELEPYGNYLKITHHEKYFGDFKVEYNDTKEWLPLSIRSTRIDEELFYRGIKYPGNSTVAGGFAYAVSGDLGSLYCANPYLFYVLDDIFVVWDIENNLTILIYAEWT